MEDAAEVAAAAVVEVAGEGSTLRMAAVGGCRGLGAEEGSTEAPGMAASQAALAQGTCVLGCPQMGYQLSRNSWWSLVWEVLGPELDFPPEIKQYS